MITCAWQSTKETLLNRYAVRHHITHATVTRWANQVQHISTSETWCNKISNFICSKLFPRLPNKISSSLEFIALLGIQNDKSKERYRGSDFSWRQQHGGVYYATVHIHSSIDFGGTQSQRCQSSFTRQPFPRLVGRSGCAWTSSEWSTNGWRRIQARVIPWPQSFWR